MGYPLGYGQNYCNKFTNGRSLFDAQGQQWITDTMQCLQLALVPDTTAVGEDVSSTDSVTRFCICLYV